MSAYRAGDRVRIRADRVGQWINAARDDLRRLWSHRQGTVAAMGAAVGRGRGLYVVWDGNRKWLPCWDEWVEPVPDEFGVEPATSG